MKKKLVVFILSLSVMGLLAGGCSNAKDPEPTYDGNTQSQDSASVSGGENSQTQEKETLEDLSASKESDAEQSMESEESSYEEDEKMDEACRTYLDFMNGNGILYTSNIFAQDDADGNYDGILAGAYTYEQLKLNFENAYFCDTTTKYAFLDLGNDGTKELLLFFENEESSSTSFVGIIHYENGTLALTHVYECGYRIEATMHETGKLSIGGSGGAGSYYMDYVDFDGSGAAKVLFSLNEFSGPFSTQIAFDLQKDEIDDYVSYVERLSAGSYLTILEYVPANRDGKGIKIAVDNYSTDAEIRKAEEDWVARLQELGAQVVSEDAIKELTADPDFDSPEIAWKDWDEKCTIVKARDYSCVYYKPKELFYLNCDTSEYAQEVLITTNKTIENVHVLRLAADTILEDGTVLYTATDIMTYPELTKNKPLVVNLLFAEAIPVYGISYTDESGNTIVEAINVSGFDGTIYFEPAQLVNP